MRSYAEDFLAAKDVEKNELLEKLYLELECHLAFFEEEMRKLSVILASIKLTPKDDAVLKHASSIQSDQQTDLAPL